MLIALILTVWFIAAAVFVLGLCSAAARPMPKPSAAGTCDDGAFDYVNRRLPRVGKLHPAFLLAIVLALVATSCATIPAGGSRPINLRGSEPAKGATQLMQH